MAQVTIPDVVRKYVNAFGDRDVMGCVESFGPDGTYSDPGTRQPLSREEIKEHFAALFVGFPDSTCETVALDRIVENRVVWRWVVRGTNTGSFRGAAPTGRQVVLSGCEFIEVQGGLIHRVEGYYDRLTFMAQLGLVPSQPAPA
ncbi:MAG: ester cyclase [Candidatus Dormibacteraceae bacterium]